MRDGGAERCFFNLIRSLITFRQSVVGRTNRRALVFSPFLLPFSVRRGKRKCFRRLIMETPRQAGGFFERAQRSSFLRSNVIDKRRREEDSLGKFLTARSHFPAAFCSRARLAALPAQLKITLTHGDEETSLWVFSYNIAVILDVI